MKYIEAYRQAHDILKSRSDPAPEIASLLEAAGVTDEFVRGASCESDTVLELSVELTRETKRQFDDRCRILAAVIAKADLCRSQSLMCETCGAGGGRCCVTCFEVERRLDDYVRSKGGQQRVAAALAKALGT